MEKDIYELIFNASQDNRLLSQREIIDICELVNYKHKLDDYCNSVKFDELEKPRLGVYKKYSKIIVFDYNRLVGREFKNIFLKNMMIVEAILHEFEHVKQHKLNDSEVALSDKYAIVEKALIYSCLNVYRLNDLKTPWPKEDVDYLRSLGIKLNKDSIFNLAKKQENLYLYSPNERMAEINSYYQLRTMLKRYGDPENISDEIELNYLNNLLRGYNKKDGETIITPPSYRFLLEMGFYKLLPIIENIEESYFSDDSFNTYKMIHGLYVDPIFMLKKLKKTQEIKNKQHNS